MRFIFNKIDNFGQHVVFGIANDQGDGIGLIAPAPLGIEFEMSHEPLFDSAPRRRRRKKV